MTGRTVVNTVCLLLLGALGGAVIVLGFLKLAEMQTAALVERVYPAPDPAAYADWSPCRDEVGRPVPPILGDDC